MRRVALVFGVVMAALTVLVWPLSANGATAAPALSCVLPSCPTGALPAASGQAGSVQAASAAGPAAAVSVSAPRSSGSPLPVPGRDSCVSAAICGGGAALLAGPDVPLLAVPSAPRTTLGPAAAGTAALGAPGAGIPSAYHDRLLRPPQFS